jgi:pantoate--beta-alanine ligase
MSSRNAYLGSSERIQAATLQRELAAVRNAIEAGERDVESLCAAAGRRLKMAGWRVDYIAVRDADTLQSPTTASTWLVVLGAAWMGKTRLIDNLDFAAPARP